MITSIIIVIIIIIIMHTIYIALFEVLKDTLHHIIKTSFKLDNKNNYNFNKINGNN